MPFDHAVHFYGEDGELIAGLCDYAVEGLAEGDCVVLVATVDHQDAILDALAAAGLDVPRYLRTDQLVLLDAASTLASIVHGGRPSRARFDAVIGTLVDRAVVGWSRVRIFGEMVALLWADGDVLAALELEELWNDLGQRHTFSLLCAYPRGEGGVDPDHPHYSDVCLRHGNVIGVA